MGLIYPELKKTCNIDEKIPKDMKLKYTFIMDVKGNKIFKDRKLLHETFYMHPSSEKEYQELWDRAGQIRKEYSKTGFLKRKIKEATILKKKWLSTKDDKTKRLIEHDLIILELAHRRWASLKNFLKWEFSYFMGFKGLRPIRKTFGIYPESMEEYHMFEKVIDAVKTKFPEQREKFIIKYNQKKKQLKKEWLKATSEKEMKAIEDHLVLITLVKKFYYPY